MSDIVPTGLTRYYSVVRRDGKEVPEPVYRVADVDAMLDAFWGQLAAGWDIEAREVFEREAATNGFRWAICQALHHTWKRDVHKLG